ncbi:hypothetical protein CEXT_135091 [Caerostris extrusa]|uniref:Uncharacterized protein n=1 Tax=Caerostris extrusa TaxID=172846 RepID=A0AAV4ULL8_CAEEX|nr:hypothetical protein CEXT_135091 [Caerostris extrusa]
MGTEIMTVFHGLAYQSVNSVLDGELNFKLFVQSTGSFGVQCPLILIVDHLIFRLCQLFSLVTLHDCNFEESMILFYSVKRGAKYRFDQGPSLLLFQTASILKKKRRISLPAACLI